MEFLIITGLSGAGKSRAADVLEDLDYYCVDNMPVAMMTRFAEFCFAAGSRYERVALVTDVREKEGFTQLLSTVDELISSHFICRILFMDAGVDTLIRRYKESRRPHPLSDRAVSLEDAVKMEMELLAPIKERADFVVNSDSLTLGRLQHRLYSIFSPDRNNRHLDITVMSFGYKYGIPLESDLVFDARFLPNPFYVDELRPLTGLDRAVAEYVFGYQQSVDFLSRLEDMIEYLIPLYIEEGKVSLTVSIGCTGGKHRSVALAEALNRHLDSSGYSSVCVNRDYRK